MAEETKTYELTGPDGRRFRITAPANVTSDQLLEYYSSQQQKGIDNPSQGTTQERFQAGVIKGIQSPYQALKQMYLQNVGPQEASNAYDQQLGQEQQQISGYGPAGIIGQGVGSVVGTAPLSLIPGGQGATGRILSGITQGAAQGLLNPATGQDSFLKQKIAQGAEGGVSGGVLGGLQGAGVKAINAFKGRYQTPEIEAMMNLSKTQDIPLSAGDIGKNPLVKGLETINEYIPFSGMAKFRQAQGEKAKSAAEQAVNSFSNGIEDVGPAIKKSMEETLSARKDQANRLYRNVDMMMAGDGAVVNKVEPTNLKNEVVDLLSKYPDIFSRKGLEAYPLKAKLQEIMQGLDTQTLSQLKDRMSAKEYQNWVQGKGDKPPLKFEDARWLRDQLGQFIDRAESAAGATGSGEVRSLVRLKSALDKDINAFGDRLPQNAEVTDAYRKANDYYTNYLGPFNDRTVTKALKPDFNTDEIFKTFVTQDIRKMTGKNQAEKLTAVTDQKGKDAINAGILQSAFNRAHNEGTDIFSPKVFASELDKYAASGEASFSPAQKEQVTGLIKLMHASERGGQWLSNPPTGARALFNQYSPYALSAAAVTAPVSTALTLGGAAGLTKLLTTDYGRRILLSANKLDVESPSMKILLKAAQSTTLRAGAEAATMAGH